MPIRIHRGPIRLAGCICCLALLAGCGGDGTEELHLADSLVRVVDEADGSPVAGTKVLVMDPRYNIPVAGPFLSGSDGTVNMGILPRTDLRLMVFGGVEFRVLSLPDRETWSGSAGFASPGGNRSTTRMLADPLGGGSLPDAAGTIKLRRVPVDSLPRIAGRVVARFSDVALDQVFVSVSPELTGYQMETGPQDDVTGPDGRFSVAQIPFGRDPDTGNLVQIESLRFTRFGFRPVVWKYDPPNGSENLDIRDVTIEMEGLDYYRGVITGLLMRDEQPLPGVTVGLGVVGQDVEKAGPGMPGWVEVSDEFGRFIFGKLPPGAYVVRPGYALGDGVVFPDQTGGMTVRIEDRSVVNVGTLALWHEIEPVDPPHGAALPTAPATLSWTAVPGVLTYQVRLDGEVLPLTTTNSVTLPESLSLTPGLHSWWVTASVESGGLGASFQISAVFRLLASD